MGGGNLFLGVFFFFFYLFPKDCSCPLGPFFGSPDKTMDLSCNNAIFTSGLLANCAHVICLRKVMKIKLQILKENIEMLPDINDMSVLSDCFELQAT